MSKKLSISRRALTLLGIGAIIAVLAPMSVTAATSVLKIQDGNGSSKAQVDGGALRVGDGAGAMTVNGTGNNGNVPIQGNVGVPGGVTVPGGVSVNGTVSTTGQPTSILAQGDCDTGEDSYGDTGTIASGKTVVGILLSDESGGSQINTLIVKTPSSQGNLQDELFTLMDGQVGPNYAQYGNQADFGPGIKLTETWSISCTGQPGASQGNGVWIAWGY